ncbi:hypothetical protein MMA231_02694 [Asticcacaulis sp. MM231]|uniref:hypothetical protein n=1 Tax=Asticcacaulis sp. MM231 TaxID=3157666 RepID=UPI0032D58C2C
MTGIAFTPAFVALMVGIYAPPSMADEMKHVHAKTLVAAHAEADANRDFQKGKCFLYVIYARVTHIPGTTLDEQTAKKKYTLVIMDGVGDNLTREVVRNNQRAVDYSTIYNATAIKNCGAA